MNHRLRLRGGAPRTHRPAEHEPASAACLSSSPAGVTGGGLGRGQVNGLVLTAWQAGAIVPRRRDSDLALTPLTLTIENNFCMSPLCLVALAAGEL